MSIRKVLLIILGVIVATFVGVFILPWVFLAFGTTFLLPNPPMPEIRYGEFPFRLEYEINGEIVIVEDIVICKFDGVGAGTNGKYLKWKQYLASDKDENSVMLLKADETTKVYYTVGDARYYMDDGPAYMYLPEYSIVTYGAVYVTNWGLSGVVSKEDLQNKCGIQIISFEHSERINNTFK